ncbi:ABC transporter permease [Bryobacter aggregatus]|uniref:ABC transporter permease n=1 Tax=Bryobacter aggregatus TaxID=360054 RepID=UPI0004E15B2E|nr:ABC transporter permease [Bryobacter aggregatus]
MAIPISYNIRNLVVRRTTTLMTALGVGLTVAVLLSVLALVQGLRSAFEATGDPLNVLVLRKGSDAELNSNFTRTMYQDLKFKPGIARDGEEPMASLEMVTIINLASVDTPDGMNITLRGLPPVGVKMRDQIQLTQGRWFAPGQREIVVGKSIANRFPDARLGGKLKFARGEWTVVGVMDGGRSSVNSEIFGDLNQVSSDYNRAEVVSSALVRATDEVAAQALINDLNADQKLNVNARSEKSYYAAQTVSAAPLQFLGIFISVVMAVGSCFAAMNTMYAAVARRAKEIGTLRVLGFARLSILTSFFLESVLLSLLGGILGCLLVLPLNNIETGIGNFVTFSEIAFNFQVTPAIMLIGMGFALFLGAIGGLFPARNAANKEILTALREV